MGQPNIQSKEPNASTILSNLNGQKHHQLQQGPSAFMYASSGNSANGGTIQNLNKNFGHKPNENDANAFVGPADATTSVLYNKQQQQQHHKLIAKSAEPASSNLQALRLTSSATAFGSPLGNVADDGVAGAAAANNPSWGDKCYVLEESVTNITTQEEYAKFDFQVHKA